MTAVGVDFRPCAAPVLVTGAAQRIGLHLAQALLARGQPVIAHYRRERPGLVQLATAGARLVPGDFSDRSGIETFVEAVRPLAPALRGIIHNASLWLDDAAVEADPLAFDRLMNVHVRAPYRISRALLPALRAGAGLAPDGLADVLHLTDAAVARGSAGKAAYMAAKAGLESLTLSLAQAFAPEVKVNAIAPALISFQADDDEVYRRERLQRSLLQIEPGADVVWRAVAAAFENRYLTGTTLRLDGGRFPRGG